MDKPQIPLFRVFMSEDAPTEVGKVLMSGFVGEGPQVKKFEKKLKKYFDNNNLVSLNSMLFLKGLPVKNNFEPLGAIVGQKPHATALAFLEKNLFTRPKTAFPSCKTTLKRKIFAARIVGNVGYPPNPTTTQGL